jgi:hypothetical protein
MNKIPELKTFWAVYIHHDEKNTDDRTPIATFVNKGEADVYCSKQNQLPAVNIFQQFRVGEYVPRAKHYYDPDD